MERGRSDDEGPVDPLFIVFYKFLVPLPAVGQKTVIVNVNQDKLWKFLYLRTEFFYHIVGASPAYAFGSVELGEK